MKVFWFPSGQARTFPGMDTVTLDSENLLERRQATQTALWRPPREDEVKFYVDSPFTREIVTETKSEDEGGVEDPHQTGDIKTSGYASTWVRDRDDEYVHPNAFDETLDPFLAKNPMMLWQHMIDWPLGKYTGGQLDTFGLKTTGLIPKVHDREPDWKHLAYHSVERGIVRTHSIGGYFARKYDPDQDRLWIHKIDLMEISIVSIPANPESIFEAAVKSVTAGGTKRPSITQHHIDQMSQILGVSPMTNPELMAMTEKQRIARYGELVAFYRKCGRVAPAYEEWNELAKDVFSSRGLEAVRGGGTRVIAFLRKVQGHVTPSGEAQLVDMKTGRVLSAKNEDSLRQAVTLIEDVLTSVDGTNGNQEEG